MPVRSAARSAARAASSERRMSVEVSVGGGEVASSSSQHSEAALLLRSDSALKALLSTLVHEAHFLVEENLNLLVDDIDEDERNLFKLDSILG